MRNKNQLSTPLMINKGFFGQICPLAKCLARAFAMAIYPTRVDWHFTHIIETLSSQGYLKTTSIMQLDDILNVLYQKAKAVLSQSVAKDIMTNPTSKQRIDTYDGNHIHAIFRETGNDFGEDILKQHYSETHK